MCKIYQNKGTIIATIFLLVTLSSHGRQHLHTCSKEYLPGGGPLCGVPVSLGHPRNLGSMSTKLITIIHLKFLTVIKVK